MSLIWECCKNQSDNEKNVLANTLPPGYDCKVTFYQLNEILENEVESQFKALVKVKLGDCSVDSVNSFLEDFYSNTNTTFNKLNADVEKVPDDDGKFAPMHRVIYSGTRKCQHRVRKKPSPTTNATRKDCVKDKNTKGRIQKKLTTDLVNMVLSPFTPLPPMGLVNKIIVKIGDLFNPPISCQDREY